MGWPTKRVILYDRAGNPLGDLDPTSIRSLTMVEEINGEHTLTVTTTTVLREHTYALTCDATGKWREWCVSAMDEEHANGRKKVGTYVLPWSLYADLKGTAGGVQWASAEAGTHDPITAAQALRVALTNSKRWEAGSVTVGTRAGVSLYDGQVWDYLSKLVAAFGGEIDAEIEVGPHGVTSRRVALLAHMGSEQATRRFDYARDMAGIRRVPQDGPYWCGIEPRGGSARTDADGVDYSDRCGIEEEPACEGHAAGSPYLFDPEAKEAFKVADGRGGWEYPTLTVCYDLDTEGDQEELLEKAKADVYDYTHPKVAYEVDVAQHAGAGESWQGVALGDETQCVDRGFSADAPLRVEGRVTRIEMDPRRPSETTKLNIGDLGDPLADAIRDLAGSVTASLNRRVGQIEAGGTIVYLRTLLDYLNEQINATGGYVYVTSGQGLLTYDRAVSDPLVGREATKVVEVKGGSVRIADSRKANGDWNWKTVFVSGHILAELVTAANIVAGYIRNADETLVIDLDAGTMTFKRGTIASADGKSEWNLTKSTFKSDGGTFTNATVTGKVTAHEGEIGGFTLAQSALYTNSKSSMSSYRDGVYVGSDGIALGRGMFEVTSAGQMECVGAIIDDATINDAQMYRATVRGTIYATSGEIGGLTLDSSSIYSGRSSHTSNNQGIYVDGDGVSVGDGQSHMMLSDGSLSGGVTRSPTGYIMFDVYKTETGIYGTRIGGHGAIALLTNSFGVGRWHGPYGTAYYDEGQSGSVRICNDYDDVTLTFEKGLMVTAI